MCLCHPRLRVPAAHRALVCPPEVTVANRLFPAPTIEFASAFVMGGEAAAAVRDGARADLAPNPVKEEARGGRERVR